MFYNIKINVSCLFLLCGIFVNYMECAKILTIIHVPMASHQIIGISIVKGLVSKGHEVTLVSPVPLNEQISNCTFIHIDDLVDNEEAKKKLIDVQSGNKLQLYNAFAQVSYHFSSTTLKNTNFQKLMVSNKKFDLILIETFGNDAFFGLAHHFNAPIVVICTATSALANHLVGNVEPFSFVPNMVSATSDRMTLVERFMNSAYAIMINLQKHFLIESAQRELYNKIFKNGPTFEEAIKNTSLVLVNTHVIFESPRPYMPNMIPIAGLHIKKPKKLPKDVQNYLDEAKDGAIYFSLGSNIASKDMPKDKLSAILNVFSKIPQKVLWKFEDEHLPGKPDNVMISQWFSQNDILAHPNVKLFITHGGLLSLIETIYRGVPIVGIPFFGDQFLNIATFVKAGYGTKINFNELNENSFSAALTEVLNNPRYYENVKEASSVIRDNQIKPMDKTIFWIEYVIRHKGNKYYQSASVDLTLCQYLLLDIIGLIVLTLGAIIIGIVILIKLLFGNSSSRKTKRD